MHLVRQEENRRLSLIFGETLFIPIRDFGRQPKERNEACFLYKLFPIIVSQDFLSVTVLWNEMKEPVTYDSLFVKLPLLFNSTTIFFDTKIHLLLEYFYVFIISYFYLYFVFIVVRYFSCYFKFFDDVQWFSI